MTAAAPWQQVLRAEPYAGPRNGLRLRMELACGHAVTRCLSPVEWRTLGESATVKKPCVVRCWVCYLKEHRGWLTIAQRNIFHY